MSRGRAIFDRVFGAVPGPGTPKLERLLWIRRYYLRNLVLVVPVAVLVLLFLPDWILLLVALPWLVGFARLSAEIRRERHG